MIRVIKVYEVKVIIEDEDIEYVYPRMMFPDDVVEGEDLERITHPEYKFERAI